MHSIGQTNIMCLCDTETQPRLALLPHFDTTFWESMQGLTLLRHPVYATQRFLVEDYYVTFALWPESSVYHISVCRLSSVTLVHPRHRLELFGNIFAPPNSSWTRTVCIKIFGQNWKSFRRWYKQCGRRILFRMPPSACNDILFPEWRRGRDETYRRCELVTLIVDLETGAQCRTCRRVPSCQFWW